MTYELMDENAINNGFIETAPFAETRNGQWIAAGVHSTNTKDGQ